MKSVRFIAQHIKDADKDNEVWMVEEWYFWTVCMFLFINRKSQNIYPWSSTHPHLSFDGDPHGSLSFILPINLLLLYEDMLWLADDVEEEVIFNIHKTNIECFYDNVICFLFE